MRALTELDFLGGVIAKTLLGGGRTATCSVQGFCMDGLSVDVHFSFIASYSLGQIFIFFPILFFHHQTEGKMANRAKMKKREMFHRSEEGYKKLG